MDRFNLNLFFALDAILHAHTLTEAARSVHLSQPAMSASLKKLRAYFNDELVIYQNGEAQLTALAIALRPRIRAILQSSREAMSLSLEFDPSKDRREIRLCAAYVLEIVFVSRLLAKIANRAPLVELASIPFTYEPVDVLLRENVDMAIVSEAFTHPDYPRQHVLSDTISCLVWSGSAFGDTMSEAAYFAARHATMLEIPDRPDRTETELHRRLLARGRRVVGVSHYSTLPHMIIGTDLVVTTMTRFAQMCAETMPLRVLPAPVDLATVNFYAQWQPYRSSEPVITWLLGQLNEVTSSLPSGHP